MKKTIDAKAPTAPDEAADEADQAAEAKQTEAPTKAPTAADEAPDEADQAAEAKQTEAPTKAPTAADAAPDEAVDEAEQAKHVVVEFKRIPNSDFENIQLPNDNLLTMSKEYCKKVFVSTTEGWIVGATSLINERTNLYIVHDTTLQQQTTTQDYITALNKSGGKMVEGRWVMEGKSVEDPLFVLVTNNKLDEDNNPFFVCERVDGKQIESLPAFAKRIVTCDETCKTLNENDIHWGFPESKLTTPVHMYVILPQAMQTIMNKNNPIDEPYELAKRLFTAKEFNADGFEQLGKRKKQIASDLMEYYVNNMGFEILKRNKITYLRSNDFDEKDVEQRITTLERLRSLKRTLINANQITGLTAMVRAVTVEQKFDEIKETVSKAFAKLALTVHEHRQRTVMNKLYEDENGRAIYHGKETSEIEQLMSDHAERVMIALGLPNNILPWWASDTAVDLFYSDITSKLNLKKSSFRNSEEHNTYDAWCKILGSSGHKFDCQEQSWNGTTPEKDTKERIKNIVGNDKYLELQKEGGQLSFELLSTERIMKMIMSDDIPKPPSQFTKTQKVEGPESIMDTTATAPQLMEIEKLLENYKMFNYIHHFYTDPEIKQLIPGNADQIMGHCQITEIGSNFHVQSIDLKNAKYDFLIKEYDHHEQVTDEILMQALRKEFPSDTATHVADINTFKNELRLRRNGYDIEIQEADFKKLKAMTQNELLVVDTNTKSRVEQIFEQYAIIPAGKYGYDEKNDEGTITKKHIITHIKQLIPLQYQQAMAAYSRFNTNTLLVSSTGSGKTAMYLYLARYWMALYPDNVHLLLVQKKTSVESEYAKLLSAPFFKDVVPLKVHKLTKDDMDKQAFLNDQNSFERGHLYIISTSTSKLDEHKIKDKLKDKKICVLMDEVQDLFEYKYKGNQQNNTTGNCVDSGASKCKLLWKNFLSDQMRIDSMTKFVALTATPYLDDENAHAKEMNMFISNFKIVYYYAYQDPIMPILAAPTMLAVTTNFNSTKDPNLPDFGIISSNVGEWYMDDTLKSTIVQKFVEAHMPKTLIIVDDKNTAIRVLLSLAQDQTLQQKKTKIFGMCGNRHMSLPTPEDPTKGVVYAPSKLPNGIEKFITENKTLYRHAPITAKQNAATEQMIKCQFNETVENAIFVIPRDPYATGSDYIGVKLLINSPIIDATQNTQLEGRVTRLCGFSSKELQNGKKTPITHYILKLTNKQVTTALASKVGQTYQAMHARQFVFFNQRINRNWKIGELPNFVPLKEEAAVSSTTFPLFDKSEYFGKVKNMEYGDKKLRFDVEHDGKIKSIIVTEDEYTAILCEYTGNHNLKKIADTYNGTGWENTKYDAYLGYQKDTNGLMGFAFGSNSTQSAYYQSLKKLKSNHNKTYYNLDVACRKLNQVSSVSSSLIGIFLSGNTKTPHFYNPNLKKMAPAFQILYIYYINQLHEDKTEKDDSLKQKVLDLVTSEPFLAVAKKFGIEPNSQNKLILATNNKIGQAQTKLHNTLHTQELVPSIYEKDGRKTNALMRLDMNDFKKLPADMKGKFVYKFIEKCFTEQNSYVLLESVAIGMLTWFSYGFRVVNRNQKANFTNKLFNFEELTNINMEKLAALKVS